MGVPERQLSDWLTGARAQDEGVESPKLHAASHDTGTWYRYYAGYADTFVADVVSRLPEATGNVLDPWNGSGTTTSVAAAHGISAQGFDLNPAAVVIAKAKLLNSDVAPSLVPLTRELLAAVATDVPLSVDDLLLTWMTPRAATAFRRLSATIDRALIETALPLDAETRSSEMSSLAAVFYLALFRVVREALSVFSGSNPTWIRTNVPNEHKLDLDLRVLRPWLLRVVPELAMTANARGAPHPRHCSCNIAVADSTALPLLDRSIDAVITSPPYCTRIDYAVSTLPELALLGMNGAGVRTLRDRLIGTPTRNGASTASDKRWGKHAMRLLRQVSAHPSHGSSSYYSPFFAQYLAGMWTSLSELSRVVKPGCPIVLVVQDSFYKELHVDVAAIMTEMGMALGWLPLGRHDFKVKTKANINPKARKYRRTSLATESVLVLTR